MRHKLAFVDTETTGLDWKRNQLWEVALIVPTRQENGDWRDEEFVFHLEPDLAHADPEALQINRYHERTAAPDFEWDDPAVAAVNIARLTAGRSIVGANPSFDQSFLQAFLGEWRLTPAWHYRLICIESVVYGWMARGQADAGGWLPSQFPWKSRELTGLIGVPQSTDMHTALGDARWVRDAWDATVTKATIEAQYGG